MKTLVMVLLAVSLNAGAEPPVKKPAIKQNLEAPAYLSPLARQLLKQRMKRHGSDMLAMLRSVLLLDHETTQRLASELAAEPRLTRAIAGGSDDRRGDALALRAGGAGRAGEAECRECRQAQPGDGQCSGGTSACAHMFLQFESVDHAVV
jgi:hypothetical protein